MALDIDRYAHVNSPLQRWDARFKIATLGVLILGIALLKTIPIAVTALVVAALLLSLAQLPREFVTNGVQFVAVFLIPFVIIMPLTYPGESATQLLGMSFSWEGLRLAVLIVLKSLAIVLIGYAIFGTSRFDISMIALQRLKCPKAIVQMLLFTYRYIFVLLAEMRRMEVAMRARGFVPSTNLETLKTFGNFVGTLLVRSFERTERIYKAMLSKGYQGDFHTLTEFRATQRDFHKAAIAALATLALLAGDRLGMFSAAEFGWF